MGSLDFSGGLPLVVGVAGHRDIPAEAEGPLRARFAEVLRDIGRAYPNTPLCVLSPLAAGADVLAAEVAFDSGIPVIATLPMPTEAFRTDFSAQEAARFDSAVARCAAVRVVGRGESREEDYVEASMFLAYYSYVLVAFWDGNESGGPGGTADLVRARLTGIASATNAGAIRQLDAGSVLQIVAPRAGRPAPPDCYTIRRRYPARTGDGAAFEADLGLAAQNVDRFNGDLRNEPGGDGSLSALMQRVDRIANGLQRKSQIDVNVMFAFAFAAGLAQLAPLGPYTIAIRVGALVLAFLAFQFARRNDYQNRYQDYRATAEGLRVQTAWCDAGICDEPVEASYLSMQQGELQWIRLALRTAYLICHRVHDAGSPPDPALARAWIEDQRTFYARAARRDADKLAAVERVTTVSLVGGMACLVVFGALLFFTKGDARTQEWLAFLTTAPVTLAGLLALLLGAYAQQRGYLENSHRYERMSAVFERALEHLDELHDSLAAAQTIVRRLGREALAEHAYWLVLRRERPLRVIAS
jgi:hypothetical protein